MNNINLDVELNSSIQYYEPVSELMDRIQSLNLELNIVENPDSSSDNDMLDQDVEISRDTFLAKMNVWAYKKKKEIYKTWNAKLDPHVIENGDARAFLSKNAVGQLCIAFRGTDNFKNFLRDINNALVNGKPMTKNKVHAGFKSAYLKIRDELLQYVSTTDNKGVLVSGHSLGGSMAHLCAIDLYNNYRQQINLSGLVTFGQPKTGARGFQKETNQNVPKKRYLRYQNKGDIVPFYPLDIFYRHSGTHILLESKKNENSSETEAWSLEELNSILSMNDQEFERYFQDEGIFSNHSIDTYYKRVKERGL